MFKDFGEIQKIMSHSYPLLKLSDLPMDNNKYTGDKENSFESKRRLDLMPNLQSFSDSVCDEINIDGIELEAIGSAKSDFAKKESDLDVIAKISANHPIAKDKKIREEYSFKMQFMIKALNNTDFSISIVFAIS